ncbi:MAG: S8 family serine peptidase, partial [Methanobacteriota archaeon]
MKQINHREQQQFQTHQIITVLFILILAIISPVDASGSKMTIGDVILKTDQLRNLTHTGGTNIPVGVISNGVIGLKNSQQSGDLPSEVLVLKEGDRSEGTAMLEIIHDIAPDAPLIYADFGGGNEQSFVTAVENLIASGARVIVDDVGFLQVPYFEDGTLASRFNQILEEHSDIILISAAGNDADAHYQGFFSDDGTGYHSFAGKTGIPVTINPGGTISVFLQWDDLFRTSSNDYNLYLFQSGQMIGMSERPQTGSEIPIEKFTYQNMGKQPVQAEIRISKARENTEPKNLEIFINARKDQVTVANEFLIPEDSIVGQAAVPRVISVAAISPENIPNVAKFSSNGYVTITWPQPERRLKPDITGVSNVDVTGSGGFPKKFVGTSAAAPHIAGLLALEWSLFPNMPADEIRKTLINSTLELGAPGWDPAFGYGLPDALKMYEQLKTESTESSTELITSPIVKVPPGLVEPVVDPPGVIMGPMTITEPGIYTLGTDIYDYSGIIIRILVSDVTIIGAGYTVEGTTVQFADEVPGSKTGIIIQSLDNTRIRNIVIQDISITSTTRGIAGSGVDGLIINRCQLPFNTNGIELRDSKDGIITNCVISGNSNTGIIVTDGSDNTTIENNKITNNLFSIKSEGSTNTHLKNNDISDNRRDNETPTEIRPEPAPAPVL